MKDNYGDPIKIELDVEGVFVEFTDSTRDGQRAGVELSRKKALKLAKKIKRIALTLEVEE